MKNKDLSKKSYSFYNNHGILKKRLRKSINKKEYYNSTMRQQDKCKFTCNEIGEYSPSLLILYHDLTFNILL